MSAPRTRQYRRVAQACDNCRHYRGKDLEALNDDDLTEDTRQVDSSNLKTSWTVSLAGLRSPSSIQDTASTPERIIRAPSFSVPTPQRHTSQPLSTPISDNLGTRVVGLYYQNIHRQPLWLFDEVPQDGSDGLVFAILALLTTYNSSDFGREALESPDTYYKSARTGVMLAIAQGSMTIRSCQTLCLLAYYNFIVGDIATAGFNISIAKNMIQLLPDTDRDSTLEAKSKLFWSIQLLSFICSAPNLLASLSPDINSPQLLSVEARDPLADCIRVPRAAGTETLTGIWSQSLKLCSLWTDVRLYVARCVQGEAKYPWQPDSDYTKLYSRLLDVEMGWPVHLSYNAVKFPSVSLQDAHSNRLELLPWVRVQITYHAIHCVLNHPCLYTSMAETPKDKLGGNTFWRSSYEKALRHCTWISRLIRTANEKGLHFSDPFFAQAAAIASTLHLYWTRTSDTRLKVSSVENLELCHNLVKEMATRWPVCKAIENALDHFIESTEPTQNRSSPAAVKTSLIWLLLDVAAPQFPNYRDQSAHSQTFWTSSGGDEPVSRSEMNTPPADMRESTARYATPPRWMMERREAGSQMEMDQPGAGNMTVASETVMGEHNSTYDLAWGAWENLGPMGEGLYMNVDWWDMNQF
ncbi:unnamed protein product [Fusarium equiseti]|uniref:Transcription factor domain-containing protein n=1 Tax=Fusarium equiseti TaxID=61235 RepID=A0A8J2JDY7_FUSEQ|nr:unnamed protein product [Fusarium equiseti]